MRTHHWLTAFLTGIVIVAGHWKAEAQFPQNVEGRATYSPVSAQQFQPGFNPYPAISPYDNVFQETYNQNGLWMSNFSNDSSRRTYLSVDAIYGWNKPPSGALVGENNVADMFFDGGTMAIDNSAPPPVLYRTFYDSSVRLLNGNRAYPNVSTDLMPSTQMSGVQATIGFESPNSHSLEFSAFGMFPNESYYSWGTPILDFGGANAPLNTFLYISDGIIGNPQDGAAANGLYGTTPTTGHAYHVIDLDSINVNNPGIPFFDGSPFGAIFRADLFLGLKWQSQVYGAKMSLIQMPSQQLGPFTVQPLFGARYINPKEAFGLEAHDSGLDYEVSFDPDDVPFPGGIDGGTDIITFPNRAYVNSEVDTHLGGAELGWRYIAGGDNFKLQGETRFGVVAGREKIQVNTQGLGQPYFLNDVDPPAGFDGFNIFYDPTATTQASLSSTYVTPTFEQSFNTTSHPFDYVPVLRNFAFFNMAKFKAGYTFLAIAQLSRPNQSIIYQSGNGVDPTGFMTAPGGDPTLISQPKVDRSFYYTHYWNFGLEWEY